MTSLRCIVEDLSGAPIEGAALEVWCLYRSDSGALRSDAVGRAVSDAEGTALAEIEVPAVDPKSVGDWRIRVNADGYAGAGKVFHSLQEGAVRDFGVIRLPIGSTLRGRVVDEAGDSTGARWSILVSPAWESDDGRYVALRPSTRSNAETGEFELHDLAPGTTVVRAWRATVDEQPQASLDIDQGSDGFVELVYTGRSLEQSIYVRLESRPPGVAAHLVPESMELRTGTGARLALTAVDRFGNFVVTDVPPGEHELLIEDSRLAAMVPRIVRGGEDVVVSLVGNVTVIPSVVDAVSGAKIDGFRLSTNVNFERPKIIYSGRETFALGPGELLDSGEPIEGLFSLPQELTLEVLGGGVLTQHIDDLVPGETREVRFELPSSNLVRGRAVRAGTLEPIPGVEVTLRSRNDFVHTLTTDSTGGFEIAGVPLGKSSLYALEGAVWSAAIEVDVVENRAEVVEFVLPPVNTFEGRILAPEWVDFDPVVVEFRPLESADDWYGTRFRGDNYRGVPVRADGRFSLPALAHGSYALALAPRRMDGVGTAYLAPPDAQWHRIDDIDVRAGSTEVHEFDLRSSFPGAMTIVVSVNGAPPQDASMNLSFGDREATQRPSVFGWVGPSGAMDAALLPSGGFDVLIQGHNNFGGWALLEPSPIPVRAAQSQRIEFDLSTHRGTIELAPTGAELPAGARVYLQDVRDPQPISHGQPYVLTDGSTRFTCDVPTARYRLQVQDADSFSSSASAEFDWPAKDSAVVVEIDWKDE